MAGQVNLLEMIRQQSIGATYSTALAAEAAATAARGTTESFRESVSTLQNIGTDQAIVDGQAILGKLQAQTEARAAYKDSGVEAALAAISTSMLGEIPKLSKALDDFAVEEEAASGFSPIQSIKNLFDVNGTRARLVGATAKIEELSKAASQLEARTGARVQLANSTAEVLTAAAAEAATRVVKGGWDLKAQEAQRAALKSNAYEVQVWAEADERTLNLLNNAYGTERAAAAEYRARVQHGYIVDRENRAKQEQLNEAQEDQSIVRYINLARDADGMPQVTGPEATLLLKQVKGGANKDLYEMYLRGQQIAAKGVPYYAFSPAGVAEKLAKGGKPNLPPERLKALGPLEAAMLELDAIMTKPATVEQRQLKDSLESDRTGAKRAQWLNQRTRQNLDAQYSFIGNNLDHPGHIGDLGSYIGTTDSPGIGELQKHPFVQKVLNGAVAGNISLQDPSKVIGMGLEAARTGSVSINQVAVDTAHLYAKAAGIKRAERGYDTFGMQFSKAPGYVVEINGMRVDVTKSDQVLRAMLSIESARMLNESGIKGPRQGGAVSPHVTALELLQHGLRRSAQESAAGRIGGAINEGVSGVKFGPEITYTPENVRKLRSNQ